jgi:hypothetical protein
MPLLATMLLILSSTAVPTSAWAQGRAFRFDHELFSITLPRGWFAAEHLPTSLRPLPDGALAKLRDAHQVVFADAAGNYFIVFADEGTELQADAFWTLRARDGGRVAIVNEGAPCKPAAHPDPVSDDACAAGNGKFEIGCPAVKIGGHYFAFLFGNTKSEIGVSLAPFRSIIATFETRRTSR